MGKEWKEIEQDGRGQCVSVVCDSVFLQRFVCDEVG